MSVEPDDLFDSLEELDDIDLDENSVRFTESLAHLYLKFQQNMR